MRAAQGLLAFLVVGASAIATSAVVASATSAASPSSLPWVQQSPGTSPPLRSYASMAYDQATGQMVLFGGMGGDLGDDGLSPILGDTWTYDGTTWTQQSPTTNPPVRYEASMTYDAAIGQIVLFGGYSDNRGHTAGETWTYDGTTWTQQFPATSPPARAGASMAYNSSTSQVVLFGGYNSEGMGDTLGLLNDTWTYDGTTWTQQSPATSPTTRDGASMAYDSSTDQMVLFGGDHDNKTYLNETWTYDGTTWTQQSPDTSPGIQQFGAMGYNPVSNQVVLMSDDSGPFGDTWTYDGADWTLESPTNSPPNGFSGGVDGSSVDGSSMDYDSATNQMVLFGGYTWDATWLYPGISQTLAFTSSAPSPAMQDGQAYTPTASSDSASGLPVTLSLDASSTGCSFDGITVTFPGPGTCIIDANQTGNDQYAPAVQVQQSFTVAGNPYHPLDPVRICDTRPISGSSPRNQCNNGSDMPVGPIAAGGTETVNVANRGNGGHGSFGVPANATSVVLNVTAVDPAAPGGHMTVYPTGASQPNTSNLNYPASETVPNLVQVGIGTGGDLSFFSTSETELVVDVEGYTAPSDGSGAGLYNALLAPARICDTRAMSSFTLPNQCEGPGNADGSLGAAVPKDVQVTDGTTVPNGATAAVLNVTVANPTDGGFLTVYPQGGQRPNASNLNYAAGQTTTNRVIMPLSASGKITVWSSEPTDVIVDVSGYYSADGGTGTQFTAEAAPVRICDTRPDNPSNLTGPASQCNGQTMTLGGDENVNVVGLAGVPANATAVVINLTGIAPSQPTFLTVFLGIGTPGNVLPNTSDLNPATGETRANMVVATINPRFGWITVANNTGNIDVAVDVLGWYA
jgi:hypothetical protein